jgi:hypothetical protein
MKFLERVCKEIEKRTDFDPRLDDAAAEDPFMFGRKKGVSLHLSDKPTLSQFAIRDISSCSGCGFKATATSEFTHG